MTTAYELGRIWHARGVPLYRISGLEARRGWEDAAAGRTPGRAGRAARLRLAADVPARQGVVMEPTSRELGAIWYHRGVSLDRVHGLEARRGWEAARRGWTPGRPRAGGVVARLVGWIVGMAIAVSLSLAAGCALR
jgi:hypothetical protein